MNTIPAWIIDLVQKTSGYIVLAIIFIYGNLYLQPAREAEYRRDLLQQRMDYLKQLDAMDLRDGTTLAECQKHTTEMVMQNREVSMENQKLLYENRDLLLELLNRPPKRVRGEK